MDQAVALFSGTVDLDRGDTHGNTRDGLHTANMGGLTCAYCAGLRGSPLRITDRRTCRPVGKGMRLTCAISVRASIAWLRQALCM